MPVKLEWLGYRTVKKCDDMLSRFHLIPERNGRTDRQTDRFAISISRVSMLTRDKNLQKSHTSDQLCHIIICCFWSFVFKVDTLSIIAVNSQTSAGCRLYFCHDYRRHWCPWVVQLPVAKQKLFTCSIQTLCFPQCYQLISEDFGENRVTLWLMVAKLCCINIVWYSWNTLQIIEYCYFLDMLSANNLISADFAGYLHIDRAADAADWTWLVHLYDNVWTHPAHTNRQLRLILIKRANLAPRPNAGCCHLAKCHSMIPIQMLHRLSYGQRSTKGHENSIVSSTITVGTK